MKKKLVLLLSVVLVMCGLLCACGSNDNTEYVEVDGERYGIGEIPNEVFENEFKFEQYQSKEITIVGEIRKVDYGLAVSHVAIGWWDIEFDTDIYKDSLAELSAGDTVCITGQVNSFLGMEISVNGTSIHLQ